MSKPKRSKPKATKKRLPFGALSVNFQGDVEGLGKKRLSVLAQFDYSLQAQLLGIPIKTMGQEPGVAIPSAPKSSYQFHPTEILYHQLQIVAPNYTYSYLADSGIYRNTQHPGSIIQQSDFLDFRRALIDGDPSDSTTVSWQQNLYNQANGAPHILVKKQCYVVVELFVSSGIRFRAGQAAIDTVNDCSYYYSSLYHIDTNGIPWADNAPPDVPCLIYYFSVEDPYQDRDPDQFNMYLQIDQSNNVVFTTIDPYVKNRGGPPPFVGKRRAVRGE